MSRNFLALLLAAGKGTRFKSSKIKVLHTLLGKSMLQIMVESILKLRPESAHVVVGYQKEKIMQEPFSPKVSFVVQKTQRGTADAVIAARSVLRKNLDKDVLVINADLPLLSPETLRPFLKHHWKSQNSLTFFTAELENPTGFGRVVLTNSNRIRIIEEKDATPAQKKIKESNIGVYLFKVKDLLQALPKISNKNKKGEFYLTDIIEIMGQEKKKVGTFKSDKDEELIGVNDRYELAQAVEALRRRKIIKLAKDGITIYDPSSTWIDLDVKIGRDTVICSSVIIEGRSVIGESCILNPFTHIISSKLGDRVRVLTSTLIEESVIEADVQVGPFSRLRPNSVLKQGAKVGNFVEMKNTVFGKGSKAGHLSYLGDSDIEKDVNIGAGTIICNYDGKKKHKTKIEEGAFIGSGTELIAPVKIGKKAFVGAGSTITKNVSPGALAVSRSQQKETPDWNTRKKRRIKK
jgi:bifunctional UDP-N-acetylglucosamine pyrophosphorylase/glucosamine-1-phosphate N-acetyltransferase